VKVIDQLDVLNSNEFVSIKSGYDEFYRGKINEMSSDFLMKIHKFEIVNVNVRVEKGLLFGNKIIYMIQIKK
jgi:hypothetical protein